MEFWGYKLLAILRWENGRLYEFWYNVRTGQEARIQIHA